MIRVDRTRYPLTVLTLADRPRCDATVFAAIRQLLDGWPSTAEILGAATLDAVECELDTALERELFRVQTDMIVRYGSLSSRARITARRT